MLAARLLGALLRRPSRSPWPWRWRVGAAVAAAVGSGRRDRRLDRRRVGRLRRGLAWAPRWAAVGRRLRGRLVGTSVGACVGLGVGAAGAVSTAAGEDDAVARRRGIVRGRGNAEHSRGKAAALTRAVERIRRVTLPSVSATRRARLNPGSRVQTRSAAYLTLDLSLRSCADATLSGGWTPRRWTSGSRSRMTPRRSRARRGSASSPTASGRPRAGEPPPHSLEIRSIRERLRADDHLVRDGARPGRRAGRARRHHPRGRARAPARADPRPRAPVDAVRAPAVVGDRAGGAPAPARAGGGGAPGLRDDPALHAARRGPGPRLLRARGLGAGLGRAFPEPLLGLDLVEYRRRRL